MTKDQVRDYILSDGAEAVYIICGDNPDPDTINRFIDAAFMGYNELKRTGQDPLDFGWMDWWSAGV